MAQISYTNKVALNENPEILDINKVTDDDMNEIKQVVNDNYNNTIQITDTEPTDSDNKIWIDTGEVGSAVSEITNEYSTSTGLGYSANYINNLHTYSTNEQRIGTWIDNNPLYRKSFTLNSDFSTWQNVNNQLRYSFASNINNIKNIWFDESASFCNFNNNYVTSINNYNNEKDYMKCNINTQTGNLQISVPSAYNTVTATIVITVKYTKTTD